MIIITINDQHEQNLDFFFYPYYYNLEISQAWTVVC